MKFTDNDLKRLKLQAENICAEQMAPMVHIDGHIVKALLARLEISEALNEALEHSMTDEPDKVHMGTNIVMTGILCSLYIAWRKAKGEQNER